MNVLYIGTYDSIHDHKWMNHFANRADFKVFFVLEKQNLPASLSPSEIEKKYSEYGIYYLGYLNTFSIRNIFPFLRSALWLRQQLQMHKIDLVHILFATPHSLWGLVISAPYIITTRGSDVLLVLPQLRNKTNLKRLYFRFLFTLFKSSFEKANLITCTSSAQLKKVTELFQVKSIQVVRTGVDVNKISAIDKPELLPADLRNCKYIFSPRFFSPVYNISLQIDAIALLPSAIIQDYTFVFIRGKYYDKDYSTSLLEKLTELKNRIGLKFIVEDYLDQESIWMWYKKASLTIMTPISDGTPNSALEAMASRCPLILPNLSYDAAIFQDAAWVLEKNDPYQLAQLIAKALTEYPTEVLELAYSRVAKLGNRQIEMSKLEILYTELLRKIENTKTQSTNLPSKS